MLLKRRKGAGERAEVKDVDEIKKAGMDRGA